MLTISLKTARTLIATLLPAVFFSAAVRADDNSLFPLEQGLNDLVLNLSRSVVTVEASSRIASNLGGPGDAVYGNNLSSGIVMDSLGHVLVTARAVLGQDHLIVRYDDRAVPARIVAVDYQSELALLECPDAVGAGLPVACSDRQSCAGHMVITMGHAYGVRAAPAIGFGAGVRSDGAMQFSVQTAPTTIGGGVFDLSGRLLGVIVGRIGANKGVTLAIPAYPLPALVEELLTHGDRHSGFVGITTQEVEISPPLALPINTSLVSYNAQPVNAIERGLLITSVVPYSPAQRAGLLAGDLIFAVNSMPVNSAAGLSGLVKQSLPGVHLDIELLRRQNYQTVELTVGRKSLTLDTAAGDRDDEPDAPEVDSLRRAVRDLKTQLQQLEHRLDNLD